MSLVELLLAITGVLTILFAMASYVEVAARKISYSQSGFFIATIITFIAFILAFIAFIFHIL